MTPPLCVLCGPLRLGTGWGELRSLQRPLFMLFLCFTSCHRHSANGNAAHWTTHFHTHTGHRTH